MTDIEPITFWRPRDPFILELAEYLKGKRVLEVFAGNGYLAHRLQEKDVDLRATTLFASHDGHEYGLFTGVEEREAVEAVLEHKDQSDVLLICWPTTTEAAYDALRAWGSEKPVLYIGETPHPDFPGLHGLSGCASDSFFEAIFWEHQFQSYHGNILEKAGIVRLIE